MDKLIEIFKNFLNKNDLPETASTFHKEFEILIDSKKFELIKNRLIDTIG